MTKNNLSHLALILDGNKRWAKKNNLPNFQAYKKGFDNISTIVDYSLKINIQDLTLFTLSSENFNRPSINIIYDIIYNNFSELLDKLIKKNNIKINIFGSEKNLPEKIIKIFKEAEQVTNKNTSLNLNLAFNYGFKDEISEAFKKYKLNYDKIDLDNNEHIRKLFYSNLSSDPELLIRTGGYQRLSNFIMYNLTYTELFFSSTLWPDFSIEELKNIINSFFDINRKYGL